jgi:hypothetical protein
MISVQKVIDEYVEFLQGQKQRDGSITMSQLGHCPRQVLLRYNKKSARPDDPRQLRVFEVGFLFERFVMDALRWKGVLFAEQIPVEYRGIKGTADGVLLDIDEAKKVLFDAKSVHSGSFKYVGKQDNERYEYQLGGYLFAMLKKEPDLTSTPRLVYVSKDDLLMAEIELHPDKDKIDKRIDLLQGHVKSGTIPDEKAEPTWECFTYAEKTKKCKVFCKYIDHCPKTLAKLQSHGGK